MQTSSDPASFTDILSHENIMLSFGHDLSTEYPVVGVEPSPCRVVCPAGVNVKAYVSLIASRRFREALEVVREKNPFPGICGRVCTHPCESFCNRGKVDEPLAICALKRFVADYELQHPQDMPKITARPKKEKVAVIGSGPAGLTAAHDLARKGYRVTVFEALSKAGGMLVAGIPSFRLPRDIIEYEIDMIRKAGVEIKTETQIGGKNAFQRLFKKGFRAIFLAVGAHKSLKLGIPGEEECSGVLDGLTFLKEVNLGGSPKPGRRVAIIGGGNTAIDAARTALRVGAEEVTIIYRRTRNEMPANETEIEDAAEEGVRFHFLAAPVEVLNKKDQVTGVKCIRMKLGKPDASGRKRPIAIQGSEFSIAVDTIIAAVSQEPDLSFLPEEHAIKISKWKTFDVDETTLATSLPGVFAGGDAVTGPTTVIDAIAAGHRAAAAIEHYLDPKAQGVKKEPEVKAPDELEIKIDLKQQKKKPRAETAKLESSKSMSSFAEIDLGFTEDQAVAEAERCLRCGPCSECVVCVPECNKLVTVMAGFNGHDERLFRLPRELKPYLASEMVLHTEDHVETNLRLLTTTCYVNEEICRGCGDCVAACEYQAPGLVAKSNGLYVSRIDASLCRGCGTCVAVCPSSAIEQNYFSKDWLEKNLQALDPSKKNVVIFTCNWNTAHLDQAIFSKVSTKDLNMLFIRTTCSGRIEPAFIFNAFERGADGVLVVGCPQNRCHYGFGNKYADESFGKVQNLLNLLGITSEKFQWAWPERDQTASFIEAVDLFLRSIREGKVCEKYN